MKKLLLGIALSLCFQGINAQKKLVIPRGNQCALLSQSKLKEFAANIQLLVQLGQQDKSTYGTTGRYATAANYFYSHSKRAYDSTMRTVNWLNTGGDKNPERTLYSEASKIMQHMWGIINDLERANWWSTISAIYHNSEPASCGKEKALELLEDALDILKASNRCYTSAYKSIPPCN
jgi:hypothetical protein